MNTKTVYDEWYGEVPKSLHRLIKKHGVSPADFQTMEAEGLSHAQMEDAIVRYSVNGLFQIFGFLMGPASLYK